MPINNVMFSSKLRQGDIVHNYVETEVKLYKMCNIVNGSIKNQSKSQFPNVMWFKILHSAYEIMLSQLGPRLSYHHEWTFS